MALSDVIAQLDSMGIIYISGYVNSQSKLTYICNCGGTHSATMGNIKQQFKTRGGKCCPKCLPRICVNKLTLDQVKLICSSFGMEYISGYIDADKPFMRKCSCGNISLSWIGNIRQGKRCSSCTGNIKYTQAQMVLKLAELGLDLVSTYQGALIPMHYICSCGGLGYSTWANIQNGKRCGQCVKFRWIQLFADFGFELLEYKSASSVTYRCMCGNITTSAAYRITEHKTCPVCGAYEVSTGRPNLQTWRKGVLLNDNFNCRKCHRVDKLEAHHIIAYSIAPELASDEDNGITLCLYCHDELHRLYGYDVGESNLRSFLYVS